MLNLVLRTNYSNLEDFLLDKVNIQGVCGCFPLRKAVGILLSVHMAFCEQEEGFVLFFTFCL